jgi:hypothetical protein
MKPGRSAYDRVVDRKLRHAERRNKREQRREQKRQAAEPAKAAESLAGQEKLSHNGRHGIRAHPRSAWSSTVRSSSTPRRMSC